MAYYYITFEIFKLPQNLHNIWLLSDCLSIVSNLNIRIFDVKLKSYRSTKVASAMSERNNSVIVYRWYFYFYYENINTVEANRLQTWKANRWPCRATTVTIATHSNKRVCTKCAWFRSFINVCFYTILYSILSNYIASTYSKAKKKKKTHTREEKKLKHRKQSRILNRQHISRLKSIFFYCYFYFVVVVVCVS